MRIVVYDDDNNFLDFIKNILDKINKKHENMLGTPVYFSEENEVKEYVLANKKHLTVFLLDIMVDDEIAIGYDLAKYIKEIEPCSIIIYVSNFLKNYMKEAYAKMKSLTFIEKENENIFNELEEVLKDVHNQVTEKVYLIAEDKFIFKSIKYKDILYIEKIKNTRRVILNYKNGFVYRNDSLISIKSQLKGKGFFLYSTKNFIVNVKEIIHIDKREERLLMSDGKYVPFSRTRKRRLLECMLEQ